MKPTFRAGRNIAMKIPSHEYLATVAFYRDILELPIIPTKSPGEDVSVRFEFGDKVLWVDCVPSLSQAEIWLEVVTDDLERAAEHLEGNQCVRRDDIEVLPEGFQGFWLANPANIIHLVAIAEES